MKKVVTLIIYAFISVVLLSGCCISHEWGKNSCIERERCIKCGIIRDGSEPEEHTATKWTIDKDVTCTENGYKYTICLKCGIQYGEIIETTGHVETNWSIDKQSTCTRNGYKHTVCYKCGQEYSQEIKSSGHNMGNWEKGLKLNEESGMYSSQGIQFRECSLCDYKQTEEVDLSTPEFESLVRRFATECTYDDIIFGESSDEFLKEQNTLFSVISFTGKVMYLDDETTSICYVKLSQNSYGVWEDTVRLFMPNHNFYVGETIKVYGVYWGPYGNIPNVQAVCIDR